MRRHKVGIAVFEYNSMCRREVRRWYGNTLIKLNTEKRIRGYSVYEMDQIGTDTARNAAVKSAQEDGVDFLFMIDHDVDPDFKKKAEHPDFYSVAMAMADQLDFPFMLGAPYCASFDGKEERVLVFRYQDRSSEDPEHEMVLYTLSRGESARKHGVEEVDAIGTGLTFFDMRCFDKLAKPYFKYEYDADHTRITITEDVFIFARFRAAGIPVYCAWDNWLGHWKQKRSGIPEMIAPQMIQENLLSLVSKDKEHGRIEDSVSLRSASGGGRDTENNPESPVPSQPGRVVEGSGGYAGAGNGCSPNK